MYILDANVISAVRRPDRAPRVEAWLRGKVEQDLFLSVITLGEIERGIRHQDARDPAFARDLRAWLDRTMLLFSDRLLAFGAEDARIWGRLSSEIGHTGADLMIAATALHHGATVVTGNVSDFSPTGVAIENPFAPR
ncbi:type II toxin-antitoxin system VapC family toxin [Natronohydrobacter thiooxidans]|uniref:type II toxin-antitoxin system VapC family toxin n=1 Tax=Natronohydrobacter thiooxidans TaxID=87172 RepID=UPI0008FF382E|nr:type II toxin-antitoxin system VapC family toxin [Natronohydrobacter thiooxidans]